MNNKKKNRTLLPRENAQVFTVGNKHYYLVEEYLPETFKISGFSKPKLIVIMTLFTLI